jgi:2-amino-4-hydroxy-6-hydroxymethyldihydropteridine diphosphokinase
VDELILGLGGNVGGDAAILLRFARVVAALETWSTVRGSRVYRTTAIGPAQPDYLNAAIAVEPPEDLAASQLLRELQAIEHTLGRRRDGVRWGPRAIDIDVLLWGERSIHTPTLEVPHPRLHERAFALAPMIDLLGEGFELRGTTLGALRAGLAGQGIELTGHTIDGAPPAPHLLDR